MKASKGMAEAVLSFVVVAIILPFVLDYFYPEISRYVTLPPSQERWAIFVIFGVLFGISSFFVNAFYKGDYPWLFGKLVGAAVSFAFYSYLLLHLLVSADSQVFQGSTLLTLIYIVVALYYVYFIIDFFEARRKRASAARPTSVPAARSEPLRKRVMEKRMRILLEGCRATLLK